MATRADSRETSADEEKSGGGRHGESRQGKGRVERTLVRDVRANPLPIGCQRTRAIIAYPTLQVCREWRAGSNDRLRRREPQEVASHFFSERSRRTGASWSHAQGGCGG